MEERRERSTGFIDSVVPLGNVYWIPVFGWMYTRSSVGATRCWRPETAGCNLNPSWITALKYGNCSTFPKLGN
jgi:hypothetical protein